MKKVFLAGGAAGFAAILYRMSLNFAGYFLNKILDFIGTNPLLMAGWLLALLLLSWFVGKLITYEPAISGGGLSFLVKELDGNLDEDWKKVLPAKFAGGFLCLLSGLAVGRAGPSIQMGAMAAKGVSRKLGCEEEEEKLLLTCGAGAGLAATFHAPLSGTIFAAEKLHQKLSPAAIISLLVSALTADVLSVIVFGAGPVFSFEAAHAFPVKYYWILLILGIMLGFAGKLYNWFCLKINVIYNQTRYLNKIKLIIPFLCAGIISFTAPQLLGSGQTLIHSLTHTSPVPAVILSALISRFFFSVLCTESGVPGGIFLPVLALGALTGGMFTFACTYFPGSGMAYLNHFVLFSMAGYFSAVMCAPLTGIILITEMTGTPNHILPLSVVSVTAYAAAALINKRTGRK